MERLETGRKRRHCLLLLCCLAIAGIAPAYASAFQLAEFEALHGTNRFQIGITVKGHRARLAAARIKFSKVLYSAVAAQYVSRGRIDGDRVRARFGGRGLVDVHFEQEGEAVLRTPPPRCKGASRTIRSGVFVGTIRFRGERGFTVLDVGRVKGKLKTIPDWKCPGPSGSRAGPSIDTSPALLEAKAGRRGWRTLFRAVAARAPDEEAETLFSGGRIEARPGMRVRRYGVAISSNDRTFTFDPGLSQATLDPPPPFAGFATFTRGIDAPIWRGPLTVDLPGAGSVRLAGNDFTARLYRGEASDSPGY